MVDAGTVDAGSAEVPLAMLRDALMRAFCTKLVGCNQFETADDCAGFSDMTRFEYLVNAEAAGRSVYHADKLAACLAHIGDNWCRVLVGYEDPCLELFSGTVTEGGTCRVSSECADELECVLDFSMCESGCCQGACMPPPVQIQGGGDGAMCTDMKPCAAPLLCHRALLAPEGICRELAGPGEPCDPSNGLCADNDTFCDPVSSTCTKRKGVGESCAAERQFECNGYSACAGGTCQVIPSPGETCTEELGCLGRGCIIDQCYPPIHEVCPLPM